MDHFRGYEQNSLFTSCEEKRGLFSIQDPKDFVVCPKPRRVMLLPQNSPKFLRCEISHQTEICNSRAGLELLDILLMDESRKEPQYAPSLASSPPFFAGSPPRRVSNPLIQDARFIDRVNPITELFYDTPPTDLLSSAKKVSAQIPVRVVEGFDIHGREHQSYRTTASVIVREGSDRQVPRVEGFDILNRGRGNSRISAAA